MVYDVLPPCCCWENNSPESMGYHKYKKYERPRQEISRILKYFIFFVNCVFWVCGLISIGLGIYLYAHDFRPVLDAVDFFFNPSILLIVAGSLVFFISFLGCTGSLRENVLMLKLFSLSLFFSYVGLVILAFVLFILFYSDSKTGISIQTVLMNALKKYHDNKNMADLIDVIQSQLNCCGVTSLGYKDWTENNLYNCSVANSSPERCGVPYSCCRRLDGSANGPNVFCGFNTQEKSISEVQNVISTDGCVHPLQKAFEGHAVIIGAVIGGIIIPVCLSVTLSNLLAKQIDKQRFLLEKEARKEERRRRRLRNKFRDPFIEEQNNNNNNNSKIVECTEGVKARCSAPQQISGAPPPLPGNHPATRRTPKDHNNSSTLIDMEMAQRSAAENEANQSKIRQQPNDRRKSSTNMQRMAGMRDNLDATVPAGTPVGPIENRKRRKVHQDRSMSLDCGGRKSAAVGAQMTTTGAQMVTDAQMANGCGAEPKKRRRRRAMSYDVANTGGASAAGIDQGQGPSGDHRSLKLVEDHRVDPKERIDKTPGERKLPDIVENAASDVVEK